MAYTRRTQHQWQQLINEQPQSGLTVKDYCASKNITVSGFYLWRKKLADPPHPVEEPQEWLSLAPLPSSESEQWQIELLRPVERAQWQHILQSKVLAMDEVSIKAGRKKGAGRKPGQMKQTYFWPMYGDEDEVAFTWNTSRGMAHAQEQLKGFNGTLLTGGYAAYSKTVEQLNQQEQKIVHATCWAHMRRAFEKGLDSEPETVQQALDIIAVIYQHEKHIRDKQLSPEEVLAYRQQHSEPLVTDFFQWIYLQRQRTDLLPKSPLSKALCYASEREQQLKVFLRNPA